MEGDRSTSIQIGLITLVGLITKHGILIVEFTNQLREEGMEMIDALIKASASACAHPDDDRRHGAGRRAMAMPLAPGPRPPADRLGDRGRHVAGHVAHHLCGADHVLAVCPQQGAGRQQGGAKDSPATTATTKWVGRRAGQVNQRGGWASSARC